MAPADEASPCGSFLCERRQAQCYVLSSSRCSAARPPTAVLRADEPPRPPTGEVRLEGGRVVDYTIHFDRNSLQDSLHLGDGLIALTTLGSLLRFELPAVRLIREQIGVEDVTCLGRGEGDSLLAGLSDGRICPRRPRDARPSRCGEAPRRAPVGRLGPGSGRLTCGSGRP